MPPLPVSVGTQHLVLVLGVVQRVVEPGHHARGVAEGRMRGDVLDPLAVDVDRRGRRAATRDIRRRSAAWPMRDLGRSVSGRLRTASRVALRGLCSCHVLLSSYMLFDYRTAVRFPNSQTIRPCGCDASKARISSGRGRSGQRLHHAIVAKSAPRRRCRRAGNASRISLRVVRVEWVRELMRGDRLAVAVDDRHRDRRAVRVRAPRRRWRIPA